MSPTPADLHLLCQSHELKNGGVARSFDVVYNGQTCRAFAIRYEGVPYAYLNRCTHVAMELDWNPDHFFDVTGQYLVCASHGALFRPNDGRCVGGPGRWPLVGIELQENDGAIFWRSQYNLKPFEFQF